MDDLSLHYGPTRGKDRESDKRKRQKCLITEFCRILPGDFGRFLRGSIDGDIPARIALRQSI